MSLPRVSLLSLPFVCLLLVACGDNSGPPQGPMVIVTRPDALVCLDGGCPDAPAARTRDVCGDGVISGDETCDDGNLVDGDGCNRQCQEEACGNGLIEMGEECEPPGTATCTSACRRAMLTCGNGKLQPEHGEECDDGNTRKGDGCRDCRIECGDAVLDRDIGEQCEPRYTPKDGNGVSTTCTDKCRFKPFCGDGKLDRQLGEECEPVDGISCIDNCKRAPDPGVGTGQCVPLTDGGTGGPPADGVNLVPNGNFGADLAGWSPGPAVTVEHASTEGASAPGSARIAYKPAANVALGVDGVRRCIVLPGPGAYELTGWYFTPAGQPEDVWAFSVVLLHPDANCSGMAQPGGQVITAPSPETGRWWRHRVLLDARPAANTPVSLSIKLGVVVPGGRSGTALWDDVSVKPVATSELAPDCGNCRIDRGETCDDGNRVPGDGCNQLCQRERNCGNRVVDPGEECDEGAVAFGDSASCTPFCTRKTTCDTCAVGQCGREADACLALAGVAQEGAGKGQARSVLCGRLRQCVRDSGCDGQTAVSTRPNFAGTAGGAFLENCYCGTAGEDCLEPGRPNGSCKAEIEAALETNVPHTVLARVGPGAPGVSIFPALGALLSCERDKCRSQCSGAALTCGNGRIEERSAEFARTFELTIEGKKQPCKDALTPSGVGCSFEECDGGPACDDNCFRLACGNAIKQPGEDCDDGNRIAGDGCDPNCKAEYACGDGKVDDRFGEECDPPNTGPHCTQEQFKTAPAACGCDTSCLRKACGNGVIQEGEECDPPNGSSCDMNCKRAGLGMCLECLALVTADASECPFTTLLRGNRELGFENGCLDDKACFEDVSCRFSSRCLITSDQGRHIGCFCGPSEADIESCETMKDHQPTGACKAQISASYGAQFGMSLADPPTLFERWLEIEAPGGFPSLYFANVLADCVFKVGSLESSLAASGVSEARIQQCVAACR